MNVSAIVCVGLLVTLFQRVADSKRKDRLPSGDGKLPSKCERYNGTVCAKYLKHNMHVFVQPMRPQIMLEKRMAAAFRILPKFISSECRRYAYPALCLVAFPPCDETVDHPKPRQFCQEECRALEQHICVNEFNSGRSYMASFVPQCSQLPPVGSAEHKKCLRLNVKVEKPVFKERLKNVTSEVGETVVLRCKVKSTKIDPTINWYKDGKIIQHGHQFYKIHLFQHSSRMKIRRLKLKDSGKFTCEVRNVAWKVSTDSWITVMPSTKGTSNITGSLHNRSSCGFLDPSSICSEYLRNQIVYFHDSQNQNQPDRLIRRAMTNFKGSGKCSEFTMAALCQYMYPVCVKRKMKHRLCKRDCMKVKRKICQKKVPEVFPRCSKLPKSTGRRGRYCKKLNITGIGKIKTKTPQAKCAEYRGNHFCEKYLGNKAIYLYDVQRQYEMERLLMSFEKSLASKNCMKYGIRGMCYHLFPVCDKGEQKSRLCKEQCVKIQTEACAAEISMIKKLPTDNWKKMFPECSVLPNVETKEGRHCQKLEKYDASHKCYNEVGADFLGVHNTTVFGSTCVSWSISRPNTGWSHNYCRNPRRLGKSPWCYVNKEGRKEYCDVPKCGSLGKDSHEASRGESTSLGRTIYVVIAIVPVILLGFVTVIVYWKVKKSKASSHGSPQGSADPFAKSSSTHLDDAKENTEIKSFILNEKMSRGKLKYVSVLGEGSFCKVYKGELVSDQGDANMNIIIKSLSEDASTIEKEAFQRETSLLCPLQHMNILGLLGISPYENTDFVVFEYLSETNLHQFLKLKSPQSNCDEDTNTPVDVLLNIASQIANGMKYLTEFNYIHGDLAARNCFIAEGDLTVKISMLGIGSHKYPSDYGWLHQGNSLYPIRWMSPEALESLVLTSENDIWAFGVLLWEIFSFGLKPYHQYSNTEVTDKVRALELLQCLHEWPHKVKTLIDDCWSVVPSRRPKFELIYDRLSNPYISLDEAIEVQV